MEGYASANDISEVVAADKKHVWHHLINHRMFETVDPRVIVEGKGRRATRKAAEAKAEELNASGGEGSFADPCFQNPETCGGLAG